MAEKKIINEGNSNHKIEKGNSNFDGNSSQKPNTPKPNINPKPQNTNKK